ncbi:hypothetical protein L873DRAFT_1712385, partial [Choiromyces venosus 120613-1]
TLLSWSAVNGHTVVVKLHMSREDDELATFERKHRFSPSSSMAMKVHVQVLRIPRAREGADPNLENSNGWTPLCWAVGTGKAIIVKMLLERADVNPNPVENDCWMPLGRARVHAHKDLAALIESRINRMGQ